MTERITDPFLLFRRLGTIVACFAVSLSLASTGSAFDPSEATFDPSAAAGWSVPTADLYGVDMVGERAYAAGYWGTLLRSTDGGATWQDTPTPTRKNLHGVHFFDELHGWAVGAQGAILRTTDGGDSWTLIEAEVDDEFEGRIPVDVTLFDVAALGKHEAWAVGDLGVIVHTADGGKNWELIRVPEADYFDEELPDRIFNAIDFTSPTEGWISGEFGSLLRSTDGGHTWSGQRELDGAAADIYLMSLSTASGEVAYASGVGGVAVATRDAGKSWRTLPVPTTAGLYAIAAAGERAVVAGDRGVIFLSTDGGDSWREPTRPKLFNWLQAAAFGGSERVVVVGEKSAVLFSTDGGATFDNAEITSPLSARAALAAAGAEQ